MTTTHMANNALLIIASTPGIPKFVNSGPMSSGTMMLALRPKALQPQRRRKQFRNVYGEKDRHEYVNRYRQKEANDRHDR